jgi:4-alpha-glucanotransferase
VIQPSHAYVPPALEHGRSWGFAANLYALRSQRNWGIGDFTDLRALVRIAAAVGAGIVGVNPLHALHYNSPESASPYSPTSRYFRNPIYIDVEAVEEFSSPDPRAEALRERVRGGPFAETLATLRASSNVQYAGVARAKWWALERLYTILHSQTGERADAFAEFARLGGERLERFAVYEALGEHFVAENLGHGWRSWPPEYRDASSPQVRQWAEQRRSRVDYFKYLQWLADEQLEATAAEARILEIGLYLDVAVGVDASSADVWSDPTAYVLDETVGAPPDPLGPLGQNWGLPAPDPQALVRNDGAAFAELIARNMAHAGALRLDHVMALLRLFRIPVGKTPADGTYVAYPFEELLSIASTQSLRARCLIVGEDLGNVPEGFRERMERQAILSYRVLLFEREDDGSFKAPERYPALGLATATTHDVPTISGWAIGRDIDTWLGTGLVGDDWVEAARATRRVDVSRLLETLLRHAEIDPTTFEALHRSIDERIPDPGRFEPLVRAVYRYLARTPAKLVLVALDDALVEFEQVNLPGTFFEYPNWRRKNSLDLEAIAKDERIAALAAEVRQRVKGEVRS